MSENMGESTEIQRLDMQTNLTVTVGNIIWVVFWTAVCVMVFYGAVVAGDQVFLHFFGPGELGTWAGILSLLSGVYSAIIVTCIAWLVLHGRLARWLEAKRTTLDTGEAVSGD